MASFFQTLRGLFTRFYASKREPVLTRYAFGHQSSFRSNMRHEFAFGVNLTAAMAELVNMRHESSFGVNMPQTSTFGVNMRHEITIKKRD